MIPELVIAVLACARLGAPHTVVFGGFSSEALSGRIQDCGAKVLVTADGGFRRGKIVPLKENADGAVAVCPTFRNVVVVKRTAHDVNMTEDRVLWYHDLMQHASAHCPAEACCIRSWYQRSRSSVMFTSWAVRLTTTTLRIVGKPRPRHPRSPSAARSCRDGTRRRPSPAPWHRNPGCVPRAPRS